MRDDAAVARLLDDLKRHFASFAGALPRERCLFYERLFASKPSFRPLFKRRWFKFTAADYGFYNHMPAAEARELIDDKVWRSYFKFAFDRNPWDRQISWYFYKTKTKASRPSFESFMASRRRAYVDNHEIYMEGGALAVDFLGRYATLEADLAKALHMVGVARKLDVPKSNVTPNKETRQDYRSYYTPKTEAVVRDWYAPEIELLNYGF